MKRSLLIGLLLFTYTTAFTAQRIVRNAHSANRKDSTNTSDSKKNSTITFDLTNLTKIDYPNGKPYFGSDEIFSIKIINYNPLRYKIGATSSGAINFMDSSSPLSSYVTLNPPSSSATSALAPPGSTFKVSSNLSDLVLQLKSIETKLANNISLIDKDMSRLSRFLNVLAAYQNNIDNWKTRSSLNSDDVTVRKQSAYNQLGDIINDFYTGSAINPYQPTLGENPNCVINYYMITDFPSKVTDDINILITNYKNSLTDLTIFETANAAQLPILVKDAGIEDYNAYNIDVNNDLTAVEKYLTDYTTTQSVKLTPFASSASLIENLEYTTTLGPFTLQQNDQLTIKISKTDMTNNIDALASFPGIIIKKSGGVKIDFSAGLFFSNLSNRSYVSSQSTHITQDSTINNGVVTTTPNQTTFSKIIRRSGSQYSYGPMAFIHFHSMNSTFLNYGGFVGTGFMFKDDSKPVLAFGGNLMLVDYQRIILGFGVAMGNVTRLSSQYQENGTYRETLTDVPTQTNLDLKAMFSLSWNLSK